MNKVINVLIFEEELIAACELSGILETLKFKEIFVAQNIEKAIEILNNHSIELALIGVNLKKDKAGIELGFLLRNQFSIPFIYTSQFADSFVIQEIKQANPCGFLLRPYVKEMVVATIEIGLYNYFHKERASSTNTKSSSSFLEEDNNFGKRFILVKENNKLLKVFVSDILFIQSHKNYVEINTQNKKYIIRSTLKKIIEQLPPDNFVKCHKQFIVNTDYVNSISSNSLSILDFEIPISRTSKDEVFDSLNQLAI